MNELLLNKSPIRATQNKQRGPHAAGRQFDMPGIERFTDLGKINLLIIV